MNKSIEYKTQIAESTSHDGIIDKIVSEMYRLINRDRLDEVIILKARELKGKTTDESIKNIYNYVVRLVPYKLDPEGIEQLTAPIHLVNGNKKGEDCDGMVMIISVLLSALGIKNRIKVISWRALEFTHVVLEAYNGNRWIELDATMKASGYDVKRKVIGRIQNQDSTQINRFKLYENPMKLEISTLEDNAQSLQCCGGGGMADCGCKGKCGCKGRKKDPTNQNINVNPIVIGSDFSNYLKQIEKSPQAPAQNQTQLIKQPIITTVEKPIYTQKIVDKPQIVLDNIDRKVSSSENDKYKLVRAIENKGNTYLFPYGY